MTISGVVQSGLFEGDSDDQQLIRLPIRAAESGKSKRRRSRRQDPPSERSRLLWTTNEHDRFLEALEIYPSGPWKLIAEHVGTRTARQTMTHAQKYRQKIERRKRRGRRDSIDSSLSESSSSSSQAAESQTREALVAESSNTPPFDATEHAVMLEFLDNFHPSEIDLDDPLPYMQDNDFLLDASDTDAATASTMDIQFRLRLS